MIAKQNTLSLYEALRNELNVITNACGCTDQWFIGLILEKELINEE